jgi:hypothetical protein
MRPAFGYRANVDQQSNTGTAKQRGKIEGVERSVPDREEGRYFATAVT